MSDLNHVGRRSVLAGIGAATLTDNTAATSGRQLTHGGLIDLFDAGSLLLTGGRDLAHHIGHALNTFDDGLHS